MEYNSFYGGRRGISFTITASFESIADMNTAFAQGVNYKTVAYGEYVIIDTPNKNDADNGKIYCRELDGAKYIGQIVGPSGKAPHLILDHYDDIDDKVIHTGDHKATGTYTVDDDDLLPGKYIDENQNIQFNNDIQYIYCSIRDANGVETTAWIGFKIPYMVIDITAEDESPYVGASAERVWHEGTEGQSDYIDYSDKYFYEKWKFKIPHGIKGDTFKNLRVYLADGGEVLPTGISGQTVTLEEDKEYLIYTAYNYDQTGTPIGVDYYLGDYNMISNIDMDEEGTITVSYTNQDDTTFSNAIKWIDHITINGEDQGEEGKIVVYYNNGESVDWEFNWVNNVAMANDGTLTFYDENNNVVVSYPRAIKWVTNVTGAAGYLKITFNNGDSPYYSYTGSMNATGALVAEEPQPGDPEPDPVFAEGSPWFIEEDSPVEESNP